MVATRSAIVTFKDREAGVLEDHRDATVFRYDTQWRTPIACRLPVEESDVVWRNGLHPVFENLTAEGLLRQRQSAAIGGDIRDGFGLHSSFGEDCIGAIGLKPGPTGSEGIDSHRRTGGRPNGDLRTISGQQPKSLVTATGDTFRVADAGEPAPWIAKYETDRLPGIVRNEFLAMRLAGEVLGRAETANVRLGAVDGRPGLALLVQRFDRNPRHEKLRMEDLAQILLKPRGSAGQGKYNGSYEEVAEALLIHSSRGRIDTLKLFERVVFFAIVGNCDGHLGNFSLLEADDGLRLSPLYDVESTAAYPGYDHHMALSICDEKPAHDAVSREMLESFGGRIGLTDAAVDSAFAKIRRGVARTRMLAHSDRDEQHNDIASLVRGQCHRILE